MEPTAVPNVGDWVEFVLQGGPREGESRPALVTGRFIDVPDTEISMIAKRYRSTPERVLAEFGMYVDLAIELQDGDLPGVADAFFNIRRVRFNDKGTRGTWHFRPADETPEA